jgi:hypothetical protein
MAIGSSFGRRLRSDMGGTRVLKRARCGCEQEGGLF